MSITLDAPTTHDHPAPEPLADFEVEVGNPEQPGGSIRVVVHATTDDLRAAAHQHSGQDHTGTLACFQPFPNVSVYTPGAVASARTWVVGPVGVLRLTPDLGIAHVAHEATHAALAVQQFHASVYDRVEPEARDALLPPEEAEEAVAWFVGGFVGQIVTQLQTRGVWPAPFYLEDAQRRAAVHGLIDYKLDTRQRLMTYPSDLARHDPCCETAQMEERRREGERGLLRDRLSTINAALDALNPEEAPHV